MNIVKKIEEKYGDYIIYKIVRELGPPLLPTLLVLIYINSFEKFTDVYLPFLWGWSIYLRIKHQSDTKSSLKELIKKLEHQTNELIGYSTGSDSYASVIIGFHGVISHSGTHNFASLFVTHNGHYPLLDLKVNCRNNDDGTTKEFTFASIVKNTSHPLFNLELIPGKEYFYTITFYSRNGSMTQRLKFIHILDKSYFTYLIRNQENEFAFYIDPLYPNINNDNPRDIFKSQGKE